MLTVGFKKELCDVDRAGHTCHLAIRMCFEFALARSLGLVPFDYQPSIASRNALLAFPFIQSKPPTLHPCPTDLQGLILCPNAMFALLESQ